MQVSGMNKVTEIIDKFEPGSNNSEKKVTAQNDIERMIILKDLQLVLIKNNLHYVFITAGMYAFSLIIIIMLMRMTPEHQANDLVTIIGLVSVIFGSILIVLVVDTSDALTAPMGILGAIAGYLFGVGSSHKKENPEE
jgi:5-bromo-4-chloroindolyl phosphate hydrolysis protein